MRKILASLSVILFVAVVGCGTSSSNQTDEQAENIAADSITAILTESREEISKTTKETLQEVDSLLENL